MRRLRIGESVVIVAGYIEVDPALREAFLVSRQDAIVRSRMEVGCVEYTFSADSSDASRVRVFEVWESGELLDAHLERRPPAKSGSAVVVPRARELLRYEVGTAEPLRS